MSNEQTSLKAGGLFTGIGGFCIGLKSAGIETEWSVENDSAAVSTYSLNLGENKVIKQNGIPKSVTEVSASGDNLSNVDILHAGFPCQSFSVAGERKGFDDPRGKLFYEITRIVKEFDENRPSVLLLENSPNLKIGDGGSWFIELSTQIKKSGYWFRESNTFELDSFDHTEIPQKRKRLFMIAFATNRFKNGKLSLDLPITDSQKQLEKYIDFDSEIDDETYYLEKNNKYYQMIMAKIDDPRSVLQLRKYEVRDKGINIIPTLTANMGQGGHNVPFILDKKGLRKLTEHECLKIQGFPPDFTFPDDVPRAKRYQQIGNSVVPPLITLITESIKKKIEMERL